MKPGSRPTGAGRLPTKLAQFRNLGLKRADHPIFEIGEQLGQTVVAMDLQDRVVCLDGVEHARFLLPRDDNRQYRKLWAMRDDGLKLLQHAFGVGDALCRRSQTAPCEQAA